MTIYIKKYDDNAIDSLIVNIFKKHGSIAATKIDLKLNNAITCDRQEIEKIVKLAGLRIRPGNRKSKIETKNNLSE